MLAKYNVDTVTNKYPLCSERLTKKLKFNLEEATKAQRGSRGIALHFL